MELKLTFSSIVALSKGYDINLLGVTTEDIEKFARPESMAAIYWAARLHKAPDLTFDQALAEMDKGEVTELYPKIQAAVREIYTPSDGEETD